MNISPTLQLYTSGPLCTVLCACCAYAYIPKVRMNFHTSHAIWNERFFIRSSTVHLIFFSFFFFQLK